jgi:hypothetical protein
MRLSTDMARVLGFKTSASHAGDSCLQCMHVAADLLSFVAIQMGTCPLALVVTVTAAATATAAMATGPFRTLSCTNYAGYTVGADLSHNGAHQDVDIEARVWMQRHGGRRSPNAWLDLGWVASRLELGISGQRQETNPTMAWADIIAPLEES